MEERSGRSTRRPAAPEESALLPASLRLAWWGTAWLRGRVSPDDLHDAVLAGDAVHLLDGDPLLLGLGTLRGRGADAVGVALPVEGDPVGVGGPRPFTDAALEVGEAALVLDAAGQPVAGLVPERVGAAVTWRSQPAHRRQLPDVGEADRELRSTLLDSAEQLARLEVARWRPEVADRLMNLRHRPPLAAPPGTPARCVELAARGLQAVEIVDLALEDDGGALTALDAETRRRALTPLARAGRRAVVAAGSPEVWPPG